MRVVVTSEEQIILRDGRPFGGEGSFGGTALAWPQAQTLAGMVRTHVGFRRAPDYFGTPANAEAIRKVGLGRMLPALPGRGSYLAWTPADLQFADGPGEGEPEERPLVPLLPQYRELPAGAGSDIRVRDWLYPFPPAKEKPSARRPALLHWERFAVYLRGEAGKPAWPEELGVPSLPSGSRIHNGLEGETGTTAKGRLFENRGLFLKARSGSAEARKIEDVGIVLDVTGLEPGEEPGGSASLGGDRHCARIEPCTLAYPDCPDIFAGSRLLKLVLMTPGDFGGWAPDWLRPDLAATEMPWVQVPGTEHEVRLRSAVLAGWDGISGWDYATNRPKATRKIVRTGSVYVVEVKEPAAAQAVAAGFWGRALDIDAAKAANGYGQAVVARLPATK